MINDAMGRNCPMALVNCQAMLESVHSAITFYIICHNKSYNRLNFTCENR